MEVVKSENSKILKYLLIIFLGSILLTISSKIKIPFYPVPMTMQTFVVLFLGMSFGYKIGLATVGLYLLEGIIGLPVFSNSPEKGIGIVYFTGPTMGYLIGFLFASYFASFVKFNDNFLKVFVKLTLAVSGVSKASAPEFNRNCSLALNITKPAADSTASNSLVG